MFSAHISHACFLSGVSLKMKSSQDLTLTLIKLVLPVRQHEKRSGCPLYTSVHFIRFSLIFGNYFVNVNSEEFTIQEHQYEFKQKFIELILQYCSDSLVRLKLHNFEIYYDSDVIEIIRKFPMLQTVEFICCGFSQDGFVNNIFPIECTQLNTLTLHCTSNGFEYDSSTLFTLNQHFPLLQSVSLSNARIVDMPIFFQKNQQITNIRKMIVPISFYNMLFNFYHTFDF